MLDSFVYERKITLVNTDDDIYKHTKNRKTNNHKESQPKHESI